jgi:hypothetical protein
MKARVSVLAQTAFSIYSRIQPIVSLSSNSSSSRSHPATSLFSGPYANSTPATAEDVPTIPSRQVPTSRNNATGMINLARTTHPMTMSNVMGPPVMPYQPSSWSAEAPGIVSAQLHLTDYQQLIPPNSHMFGIPGPDPSSAWNEPDLIPNWDSFGEIPYRSDTNHTSLPSIRETLQRRQP